MEVIDMAVNIQTEPELLNLRMSEEFDWSDDKDIVRDAIWNHIMEANNRDTIKTEEAMKPFLDMTDDQVRDYVEKNLKK
ncbi:hypothetical protein FC15_GL001450 [Lapidilactobacillus concavus DSM 17758]|uniref:Uncharacterized protein n=2 Tax=Lapidilactobacillus TaxID=2767884 RepID=A0A0R1W4E8_9LACO|nr:hypothetical protein FC15_GL001450 [Lapidilactobacillus concavus DSM 17758]